MREIYFNNEVYTLSLHIVRHVCPSRTATCVWNGAAYISRFPVANFFLGSPLNMETSSSASISPVSVAIKNFHRYCMWCSRPNQIKDEINKPKVTLTILATAYYSWWRRLHWSLLVNLTPVFHTGYQPFQHVAIFSRGNIQCWKRDHKRNIQNYF